METISLNGAWQMRAASWDQWDKATVPGSVYSDLLANGRMEDPYYRDNEDEALKRMDEDYQYRRCFSLTAAHLSADALLLQCKGLDTLATVRLNGRTIGEADNMHRTWVFDIKPFARAGENQVEILFASPTRYIDQAYADCEANGAQEAMRGFPHLRKAHCMFGWDWGPRLPDCGIWRDIEILAVDTARLTGVRIFQTHADDRVTLRFDSEIEAFADAAGLTTRVRVTMPDGTVLTTERGELVIDHPQLWWPSGYGEQPLYAVEAILLSGGQILDVWHARIGLRTLTVNREKDSWGESFAFTVNGVSIFAMGGDYIPEDNLRCRITPERTRRLLSDCKIAHHNCIRVWGGGYYPDDWFYDLCDEFGLIVWQDFMFACATYELTTKLAENIREEVCDNVRRLRHHAALGLWCGNNELEWQVDDRAYKPNPKQVADYIRLFEYLIPNTLRKLDDATDYWPSSPSSGGGFDEPNAPDRGDVHYWAVWHQDKPFTEYRKFFFRFASEFGFQSFPCLETVARFAEPEDRNIFSYVMEKHQRNEAANGKIMNYLAQTYLYPKDFDHLLYASQLLQADAVRYGVEHWRRNRGRCMGAIYWQVNDCWPVASWSSIDYMGCWKALHYASKRFFAPVLLSCCEEGTLSQKTSVNKQCAPVRCSARLNLSNETRQAFTGRVLWSLRDAAGRTLRAGEQLVQADPLSAVWLDNLDFPEADLRNHYVSFALYDGDRAISQSAALFCAPKHFVFQNPHLTARVEGDEIVVSAQAFAHSVEIACPQEGLLLEDNYFDMDLGERRVRILRGNPQTITLRSVYDISAQG